MCATYETQLLSRYIEDAMEFPTKLHVLPENTAFSHIYNYIAFSDVLSKFAKSFSIGVGASLAGPVWPNHLFGNLMKFIIDIVGVPAIPHVDLQ